MGVVLLVCSDITKLSVAVIFAMGLPTASSHTHQGCITTPAIPTVTETDEWLEQYVAAGFKVWQIMFLCFAGLLTIVIFLCCCIRFRIPRTKQEIEADYIRKKITKKFQKQLKIIQNSEMDNMDLKRGEGCSFSGCVQSESGQTDALDRIRAEFKSDTESLAQSEALSGATLSSGCNCQSPGQSSPVRPSEDHVGINMEDASATQTKPGTRFSFLAESLSKLRPKKQ